MGHTPSGRDTDKGEIREITTYRTGVSRLEGMGSTGEAVAREGERNSFAFRWLPAVPHLALERARGPGYCRDG